MMALDWGGASANMAPAVAARGAKYRKAERRALLFRERRTLGAA